MGIMCGVGDAILSMGMMLVYTLTQSYCKIILMCSHKTYALVLYNHSLEVHKFMYICNVCVR